VRDGLCVAEEVLKAHTLRIEHGRAGRFGFDGILLQLWGIFSP
jgi:hypothetical protein